MPPAHLLDMPNLRNTVAGWKCSDHGPVECGLCEWWVCDGWALRVEGVIQPRGENGESRAFVVLVLYRGPHSDHLYSNYKSMHGVLPTAHAADASANTGD